MAVLKNPNAAGTMGTTEDWGSLLPKGIGNAQEASQATSAIRQSPWYQDYLTQQHITPQAGGDQYGNVSLNDQQEKDLLGLAQQHGVGINENDYHIDQNGQIAQNDSHLLRNILIGAGVGGSFLIPGVGPALLSTLGTIGHGAAAGLGALGHGAEAGLGKLGGLFGLGGGGSEAAGGVAIPGAEFDPSMVYGAVGGDSGAGGGGMSILGGLGKIFGGGRQAGGADGFGLDPNTLLLGALKLIGTPSQQRMESFTDPGSITDPKQALYQALQGTYRMGAGLEQRKPTQLRSAYVQAPPAPVTIPGIPFQIGGGLGHDPALDNPDLLTSHGLDGVMQYGPFQGIAQRTQQGLVK